MQKNYRGQRQGNFNEMIFVRQNIEDVEVNLKEDLNAEGANTGGLDEFFAKSKQRKEQNKNQL